MRKLLLMSILVATFWIPFALAKSGNPEVKLKSVQKWFAVFCAAYVLMHLYVLRYI